MPFYYFSLSLSLCFSPLSLTALCFDEPSDIKQRKGRENTKITKKTGKIESNGTVRDIPLPPPNRKRRRRRRREKKRNQDEPFPNGLHQSPARDFHHRPRRQETAPCPAPSDLTSSPMPRPLPPSAPPPPPPTTFEGRFFRAIYLHNHRE